MTIKKPAASVAVKVRHCSSIPHARWCSPVGWSPRNAIEGAEWHDEDAAWLDDDGEAAGLVLFCGQEVSEGDTVTVELDELRIVSSGDCRVIGPVEVDFK